MDLGVSRRSVLLIGVGLVIVGVVLMSWPLVRARVRFASLTPLEIYKNYVTNPKTGASEWYYLRIAPTRSSFPAGELGTGIWMALLRLFRMGVLWMSALSILPIRLSLSGFVVCLLVLIILVG